MLESGYFDTKEPEFKQEVTNDSRRTKKLHLSPVFDILPMDIGGTENIVYLLGSHSEKIFHIKLESASMTMQDNSKVKRPRNSLSSRKRSFWGGIPSYLPELNPDERVWNHLELRLGKVSICSKEEMKSGVLSIMRSIQKDMALIQSFYKMKDTKYIVQAVEI